MNRAEKATSIGSIQSDLKNASLTVVAEYRGLTAGQMNTLRAAVRKVEDRFAGRGRIVLRPSGTEPVIRVMVEGEESSVVTASAHEIAAAVELAAAAA